MKFEKIKKWFDSDKWDIGYLTKEQLKICSYFPVKSVYNRYGWNYINDIHFEWAGICNGLVLIKNTSVSLDYGLYDEATKILIQQGLEEWIDWAHVYTNFKEAEILSGRGVRARNSLVYNYKFGFDSKVCVIGFMKMIENPPKIKRVAGNNFKDEFWHKCIGCDACRKSCPVGAIHNEEKPYWLDSSKCDDFLGLSNHPKIPSMKKFWHENVHPEIPKKLVDKVTNWKDAEEWKDGKEMFMEWNANGYSAKDGIFCKDGKPITVPICRECQVQSPCSKWDGKYPYGRDDYHPQKMGL